MLLSATWQSVQQPRLHSPTALAFPPPTGLLPDFSSWSQLQSFWVAAGPGLSADPLWLAASPTPALPNLREVFLAGINASIPSWTGFKERLAARAPGLEVLGVSSMQLAGPIGPLRPYFPLLRQLHLSANQLTGTLPEDLAQYPAQLTQLKLAGNQLRGTLPTVLLQVGRKLVAC
jgi:hypothetical protein